jgi:uncharacterized phage protein gp47/JayE
MADLTTERASDILERALDQLDNSSQLTRFSPGSKTRSLLSVMAAEAERLEDIVSANVVLSLLSGAKGVYLDFLGSLVGAPRKQSTSAAVTSGSQTMRISSPSGTSFSDLNNGTPITIPSGTILQSTDGVFKYSTSGSLTLVPTDTEDFVGARALDSGIDGNVSAGTITEIDFTAYSAHPSLELVVENVSAIDSGTEEELDDFYRFRIQNAVLSAETANAVAIRLGILQLPSVSDVVTLDLFRGIGTADMIIDTVSGEVSNTTLIQAQDKISRLSAVGMNIQIRAPRLIGLEVVIKLKFASGTSEALKSQSRSAVRNAIARLVAEIEIGGVMLVNDIAFAATSAHEAILDIGRPNRPLEEVVIWRDSELSGRAPLRLQQNKDIELKIDQRLTMEGSLTDAVKFVE